MNTLETEMLDKQADDQERDRLGRIVREVWIAWAKNQPAPKASWLVHYDLLHEQDKEVDRLIGERLFEEGCRSRPNADSELAAKLRILAANQRAGARSLYASGLMNESAKKRIDEEADLLDSCAHELELMDETLYLPMSLFNQRVDALQKMLDDMTAARDNAVEALHLMQAGQI